MYTSLWNLEKFQLEIQFIRLNIKVKIQSSFPNQHNVRVYS